MRKKLPTVHPVRITDNILAPTLPDFYLHIQVLIGIYAYL